MPKGVYAHKSTPLRERLLVKTVVDLDSPAVADDAPCWNWTGRILPNGYGVIWSGPGGRNIYVHRAAYELWFGPVPGGLEIDHLCRNRSCCNPAHLEAVTKRENMARGIGRPAHAIRTDTCIRGHPYTLENTYWYNGRNCKQYARARSRAHSRKKRGRKD